MRRRVAPGRGESAARPPASQSRVTLSREGEGEGRGDEGGGSVEERDQKSARGGMASCSPGEPLPQAPRGAAGLVGPGAGVRARTPLEVLLGTFGLSSFSSEKNGGKEAQSRSGA